MEKLFSEFLITISKIASSFGENIELLDLSAFQIGLDILLVAILIYFVFIILKASRGKYILIGLSVLAILFLVSKWLNLLALRWLLDKFLTVAIVAIPIIFQQELRQALEKIGHTQLFTAKQLQEVDLLIASLVSAATELAEQKKGALIVLQQEIPLKEYVETGYRLNAHVSRELLVTIFEPKTPLHDGAVIIHEGKILAAGCTLPHSFKKYDIQLGTRHKSALALSDSTDAKILVVSEERGHMSVVENGEIKQNITAEQLENWLTHFLKPKTIKKHKKQT